MADITQTAANVRPFSGARTLTVTAATTVVGGDLVYKDTTDSNKYRPCDSSAAASAIIAGMALTNSSDTEELVIQLGGEVNPGGTVAVGEVYSCSSNAGKIAPNSDVASGNFGSIFGIGIAANKILMAITNTSTAHA